MGKRRNKRAMNGLVGFRLCTLTDDELLRKVDAMTDTMYQTGKIPTRNIPALPNDDYDLLVGELVQRHKTLTERFQLDSDYLWKMAAEIIVSQKHAQKLAPDAPLDWQGLESDWYDWLCEKLLPPVIDEEARQDAETAERLASDPEMQELFKKL